MEDNNPPQPVTHIDPEVLGDIDAWNVRHRGDEYIFSARFEGQNTPRDYRRAIDGGDIIADTPGPLFGVLSIGGARRAGFNPGPPIFSYHIVAPGDDIGSVGLEGSDDAKNCDTVQVLPHRSRDALIAQALLDDRYRAYRALPLILVRAETDASASIVELQQGRAFENLMQAADNLKQAATKLGKRPRLLAVGLDYGPEDVISTREEYRAGLITLMRKIEKSLTEKGFHKPLFVATLDCGTVDRGNFPHTLAQWDLSWDCGDYDLIFSAPSYMFEQTELCRPTPNARIEMAEMDAQAISAVNRDETWFCPTLLLAEQDAECIRITARAMTSLVLDQSDPLAAGPHFGFSLSGVVNGAQITEVTLDPKDPKALILRCDKPPEGPDLAVRYAFGDVITPGTGQQGYPLARGTLRDDWQADCSTGRVLYRWAMPCDLSVN